MLGIDVYAQRYAQQIENEKHKAAMTGKQMDSFDKSSTTTATTTAGNMANFPPMRKADLKPSAEYDLKP